MRKLSIAALVAGLLAMILLAGCGGGGGTSTSGSASNPPPAGSGLAITGRVVSTQDNGGVANVQITLGNPAVTATTNNNGNFTLYLPEGKTVLDILPFPYNFKMNSSSAGANFPVTTSVLNAAGDSFDQESIPVPAAVIAGQASSLGTFKLVYFDPGGGPPPPP